ncbi:MAG: MFS transporter, partial [Telluria sp.]
GISNLLVVAVIVALTLDLSINIGFNPTRALIADVTPEGEARTRGFTWMQTISGFWGVMAYLIGAFIDNYALISIGVVIVFVFSVVPMFFVTEPRDLVVKNDTVAATRTEWGQLWRIYFAHGFSWIGVQSMFVYIIAFIQQHIVDGQTTPESFANQSGHVIAISFAVMNVVGFLLPALVLAPLAARIGRVKTQVGCIAIMACAYFAIAYAGYSTHRLYALMAVVGIGWSAIVSLPFAIMSEKVDKSRMGFFMGIFNLSVVIPQLLSTGVGYVLKSSANSNILFIICGSCLAVSAVLWCLVSETKAATKLAPAVAAAH